MKKLLLLFLLLAGIPGFAQNQYPFTYTCGVSNITAASAPTNIVTLTGSSNPNIIVRVTQFHMYATQTTGGTAAVLLNRQSAADSGGTFVQDGMNPYDTHNPTSTVICGHYTANPAAVGTVVGALKRYQPLIPVATSIPTGEILEPFGDGVQPIVLRGSSDILAVNLGGATLTGLAFTVQIEWTETVQQ